MEPGGQNREPAETARHGTEEREDRYRVGREIGRGEMSVVYEAFDPRLERRVAFKLLTLGASLTEEQREGRQSRFKREAEAIARLRHPNIVDVYDFGRRPDGLPFLVMEYVDGPTLGSLLAKAGPLSPSLAASILDQIADGLDAVHAEGVIHRDLKPGNIMILGDVAEVPGARSLPRGTVKLLDFGLARHDDDVTLTRTGVLVGSPAYLSPERVRGEPATRAADLWALSVVLYEMLAGRRPFAGEDTVSVLYQIAHTEAPRLQGIGPHVEAVLSRALSRDPRQRFSSGHELSQAFRTALSGSSPAVSMAVEAGAPARPHDPGATVEVGEPVAAPPPVEAAPEWHHPGFARAAAPAADAYQRRRRAAALVLVCVPAVLALGGFGFSSIAARGRASRAAMTTDAAETTRRVAAAEKPSQAGLRSAPGAEVSSMSRRVASASGAAPRRPAATPRPTPAPRTTVVYVPASPTAPAPLPAATPRPVAANSVRASAPRATAPRPSPTPFVVAQAPKRVPPAPPAVASPKPESTPAPKPTSEVAVQTPAPKPSRQPSEPRFQQVAQNGGRPIGIERPAPPKPASSPTERGEPADGDDRRAAPAPIGDGLLGVWRGNIYKHKAEMRITGQDGDGFRGVLTLWTEQGVAKVSVNGQIIEGGTRVTFESAGFLPASAVTNLDIGKGTGGIISPRWMAGKALNSKGDLVFWSLRR